MSSLSNPPITDYWQSKLADRCQIIVRYTDNYNPIGDKAIESFIDCVRKLTNEKVPYPIDYFHLPRSQKTYNDKRFVFACPNDAHLFVQILESISFVTLHVDSVSYVDLMKSREKLDNEGVRVRMTEEGGAKQRTVTSKEGRGLGTRSDQDTYKDVLDELNDPNKTPNNNDYATPMGSPEGRKGRIPSKRIHEESPEIVLERKKTNDKRGEREQAGLAVPTLLSGAAAKLSLFTDDSKQVQQHRGTGVARKPDYSSKSSSPIDEPSKYDHPRTVEDAIKRVDALKKEMKTIMKMGKENVPNWDGKIKKKREDLKELEELMKQFEEVNTACGMDWEEFINLIN